MLRVERIAVWVQTKDKSLCRHKLETSLVLNHARLVSYGQFKRFEFELVCCSSSRPDWSHACEVDEECESM